VLVDPDVVAARVAGLSFGFCLWDEVGTTWSCGPEGFERQLFDEPVNTRDFMALRCYGRLVKKFLIKKRLLCAGWSYFPLAFSSSMVRPWVS